MTLIYNLAIAVYHFVISILSPINKKAWQYCNGRKNWQQQLSKKREPGAGYVWVHCASLGEFEQGRPLIEAIRQKHPEYKIALTFFSPSGFEIRKNYASADLVMYLPADTPKNALFFVEILNPRKVFFVKYEFWYHYIMVLHEKQIPLFLISGIFRKNQVFFSKMYWGKWFQQMLHSFSHFFVQDKESAALLAAIGIGQCTVAGDTRFDRVATIAAASKTIPLAEKFADGFRVLVAGSTWKPDEELIARFINENEQLKCIIAPHEVSQANINRIEQMLIKPAIRLSMASESEIQNYQVLIIDSVGVLSSIYRYGTFAYIGGGFGVGIHNILEAATFGLPVVFGPNYIKFREACQMIQLGGAFSIKSYEQLSNLFIQFMENPQVLIETSKTTLTYVKNNQGATGTIMEKAFG